LYPYVRFADLLDISETNDVRFIQLLFVNTDEQPSRRQEPEASEDEDAKVVGPTKALPRIEECFSSDEFHVNEPESPYGGPVTLGETFEHEDPQLQALLNTVLL